MKIGNLLIMALMWGMGLIFLVGGCTAHAPEEEVAAAAATGPVSVAQFEEGRALARVTEIDPEHGNIESEFVASDLERLGLSQGDQFVVEANGIQLLVTWATTYADVARGEGVAFANWEGKIRFARNWEDASVTLGVGMGDGLVVRPLSAESR